MASGILSSPAPFFSWPPQPNIGLKTSAMTSLCGVSSTAPVVARSQQSAWCECAAGWASEALIKYQKSCPEAGNLPRLRPAQGRTAVHRTAKTNVTFVVEHVAGRLGNRLDKNAPCPLKSRDAARSGAATCPARLPLLRGGLFLVLLLLAPFLDCFDPYDHEAAFVFCQPEDARCTGPV